MALNNGKVQSGGSGSAKLVGFDTRLSNCKVKLEGESGERCATSGTDLGGAKLEGNFGTAVETVTLSGYQIMGEIDFTNNGAETCPGAFAGDYQLVGTPKCTLKAAETEAAKKALVCKNASLTAYGNPVSLNINEELELTEARNRHGPAQA